MNRKHSQLFTELFRLHSKRYPLEKIRAIRISCKVTRSNNRDRTTFPIHLSGIRGAVVSNHGNPWFSRVLAEQLARLVGVPLLNRVYGESSTRPPEELDLPLIRRWIRDDVRFDVPRDFWRRATAEPLTASMQAIAREHAKR